MELTFSSLDEHKDSPFCLLVECSFASALYPALGLSCVGVDILVEMGVDILVALGVDILVEPPEWRSPGIFILSSDALLLGLAVEPG